MRVNLLRSLKFLTSKRDKRYAVQVGSEQADDFNIPEAKIVESWQNPDGSRMIILESKEDLRAVMGGLPGVERVQKI